MAGLAAQLEELEALESVYGGVAFDDAEAVAEARAAVAAGLVEGGHDLPVLCGTLRCGCACIRGDRGACRRALLAQPWVCARAGHRVCMQAHRQRLVCDHAVRCMHACMTSSSAIQYIMTSTPCTLQVVGHTCNAFKITFSNSLNISPHYLVHWPLDVKGTQRACVPFYARNKSHAGVEVCKSLDASAMNLAAATPVAAPAATIQPPPPPPRSCHLA
eukprot:364282-Chlamydomonas_euryale.AAC.46